MDYTRALLDARKRHEKQVIQNKNKDALLKINSVTAGYGKGQDILQDINISVERGKTVAVVGESGSGKSTLARVITGLLAPRAGEIYFNGNLLESKLSQRLKEQLQKTQMIYKLPDVAINPRQKVRDIIGRPLSFYLGLKGKEQ